MLDPIQIERSSSSEMHVVDGQPIHTFVRADYTVEVSSSLKVVACKAKDPAGNYDLADLPRASAQLTCPCLACVSHRRRMLSGLEWTRLPRSCPLARQAALSSVSLCVWWVPRTRLCGKGRASYPQVTEGEMGNTGSKRSL